jgi:hypothetical protein
MLTFVEKLVKPVVGLLVGFNNLWWSSLARGKGREQDDAIARYGMSAYAFSSPHQSL